MMEIEEKKKIELKKGQWIDDTAGDEVDPKEIERQLEIEKEKLAKKKSKTV